ncbi:MAG: hypothetical protein QOI38_2543 [Sphingomonadales bacterium]|jgi:hypothetical protein|nr:hypothetical protein [Sphingomonadales bacterium]
MSDRPGPFDFAGHKARNRRLWQETGWDDLAAFIGLNAESFHGAWEATRAKNVEGRGGIAFGFCWPALLFGFAWFLYRKMWAFGLLLLVLPIALSFMFESPGGQIGLGVAMAMFAKGLYVQHALSQIDKVRAGGGDEDAVRRAGGVSILGGAIGGAILAAGIASLVYLLLNGAG